MTIIHTYPTYDARERALDAAMYAEFKLLCEQWGGVYVAGVGGALSDVFGDAEARGATPPPCEFGEDGGRIDCVNLGGRLWAWLFSSQSGDYDAFLVEANGVAATNMRHRIVTMISYQENMHQVARYRYGAELTGGAGWELLESFPAATLTDARNGLIDFFTRYYTENVAHSTESYWVDIVPRNREKVLLAMAAIGALRTDDGRDLHDFTVEAEPGVFRFFIRAAV